MLPKSVSTSNPSVEETMVTWSGLIVHLGSLTGFRRERDHTVHFVKVKWEWDNFTFLFACWTGITITLLNM